MTKDIRQPRPEIAAPGRRPAREIQAGTIVRPFVGDGRFDVTAVENTPQGSTILRDAWRGLSVEMDSGNHVEILGFFNL